MTSLADRLGFGPLRKFYHHEASNLYRVDVTPALAGYPTKTVWLSPDQFGRLQLWLNGALIQNVLSDLSADEREILMTGLGREPNPRRN